MISAVFLRSSRHLAGKTRLLHNSSVTYLPIVQFKLSDIGEGIAEVQVKEWHVKEGDSIAQFDNLCDVQSDKAAVTITSRYDGTIKKLYYKIDDLARVGLPLVDIDVAGGENEQETKKEEETSSSASAGSSVVSLQEPSSGGSSADFHARNGKVLTTPAVRRLAMENKISLKDVTGTGRDGRVLKEDVLKFLGQITGDHRPSLQNVRASPPGGLGSSHASGHVKTFEPLHEDRLVPVRGYTRAMIKTMTEALKIPHFGYDDEINVDAVVKMRHELKKLAEERGVKLSYMPFFIKACSLALLEFPSLNATVDEKLENITYKAAHNICLAMDTPGGLVVPNIKHCEQRSIFEIAAEIQRLHENGKRQAIVREDLTGGTFTLSNIGAIGGTYASPVIFPPQVAIGALGKMERLPRFDKHDNVVPVHLVKVSWAADHRVVDGATMARFSNRWKHYLEHPSAMLAQLK